MEKSKEILWKCFCVFCRFQSIRLTSEMEKAADAADMSVLFFSAGANF